MRKLLILALFFLLTNLASADIVSVNSGGNNKIVVIPNLYVEGFFIGIEQPGPHASHYSATKEISMSLLCNISIDYDISNVTQIHLLIKKLQLMGFTYFTEQSLVSKIKGCPPIEEEIKISIIWIIIALILVLIGIVAYHRKKLLKIFFRKHL